MANERVRMLWPDHLGLARGKYLPAALAHEGTGHAAAVYSLAYDRSFIAAPGSGVLDGFPDVHATFDASDLRPGWDDDRTQVAVCDLSQGGEPFRYSARYALRKAIADWEALGYRPMVGIEFEAYVLELIEEHGWQRWDTPESYVYGTGRLVDPIGLIDDIVDLADGSDITLESVNAEFDSGQFELTLRYADALRAADDAFLFKVLARECAMDRGRRLTFLGKPYADLEGNGVHVNFSLVDADGNNVLADPSTDDGLSGLAKSCLAGLCAHHQGLNAAVLPDGERVTGACGRSRSAAGVPTGAMTIAWSAPACRLSAAHGRASSRVWRMAPATSTPPLPPCCRLRASAWSMSSSAPRPRPTTAWRLGTPK